MKPIQKRAITYTDRELGPVSPELQGRWDSFLVSFDKLCLEHLTKLPDAEGWTSHIPKCLPGVDEELAAAMTANQPACVDAWLAVNRDRTLYIGVTDKHEFTFTMEGK